MVYINTHKNISARVSHMPRNVPLSVSPIALLIQHLGVYMRAINTSSRLCPGLVLHEPYCSVRICVCVCVCVCVQVFLYVWMHMQCVFERCF